MEELAGSFRCQPSSTTSFTLLASKQFNQTAPRFWTGYKVSCLDNEVLLAPPWTPEPRMHRSKAVIGIGHHRDWSSSRLVIIAHKKGHSQTEALIEPARLLWKVLRQRIRTHNVVPTTIRSPVVERGDNGPLTADAITIQKWSSVRCKDFSGGPERYAAC